MVDWDIVEMKMEHGVRLTVSDALALSERQRQGAEWTLLAWDVELQAPTYACSACYRQRFTIVTKGARLPDACPVCRKPQATPPGAFPPPVPAIVVRLKGTR